MDHETFAEMLGNYGDFLGAIAVLGTLLYLAVQIRQNKYAIERDSTRSIITDWQAVFSSLAADQEFARIIRRAVNDWDGLSKNEQLRAHVFFSNLFTHYGNAIRMETEELSEMIADWENNIIGLLLTPGGSAWYATTKDWFFDEPVERLNRRLSNLQDAPPSWSSSMPWWQVDDSDRPSAG